MSKYIAAVEKVKLCKERLKKYGGEEMYSESYFEKALVPKEVRTCRDLNAIREETAKEQKGRMGNVIKWEISKRNVTTPTNDPKDRNTSTPKFFLQYFDSPSPL